MSRRLVDDTEKGRLDHEHVAYLRQHSAAWRLLRADNAPLVLSFLGQVFVEENSGAIAESDLVTRLADIVYGLRTDDEPVYPRTAREYLDAWAAPDQGWLRKFYPPGSDEPSYDATPALEKAYGWVSSLQTRSFVGTESRLHTLVDLLRQMVHGAESDPEARLTELRRRRDELDTEIAEVEKGIVRRLDGVGLRDRYQLFASTARELLSDFREVEDNFRGLDRAARERIAVWDGSKGELLEELLGDRNAITGTDQGRSFQAFYDFLLSRSRQDELADLLQRVQDLDDIEPDRRVRHVDHDWLDAAERTQQTVRQLSEQLRRFLDDKVWLENRRVMDLLRSIEAHALTLQDGPRPHVAMELDATAVTVGLPMERPLYAVRAESAVDSLVLLDDEAVDAAALFEQTFVDTVRLAANAREAVRRDGQVSLIELLDQHPPVNGLAEIVGYLALTEDDISVVVDEETTTRIPYTAASGDPRTLRAPQVSFAPTTSPRRWGTAQMSVDPAELTATVVALMKGVVYRDTHEVLWQNVLRLQPHLRDHFDVTGLVVVVDEAEGFAYLRSRPVPEGEEAPPRLVARRTLTFQTSLLLALLRKKLAEHDATSSEARLVLSRDQLVDMVRVFLPGSSNEAKVLDQLDATIGKVVELGYLRRVRGDDLLWEVRRILKAFVDAEWLAELDTRLTEYAAALQGDSPPDTPSVAPQGVEP